jgi:hypothetical protein
MVRDDESGERRTPKCTRLRVRRYEFDATSSTRRNPHGNPRNEIVYVRVTVPRVRQSFSRAQRLSACRNQRLA